MVGAVSGAQKIVQALEALAVPVVFGVPGTQNVELFGALAKSKIRVVVPHHELSAAFMAIGYASLTRWPAILTSIAGPGLTYALSGLAEASHDSVPLVYLAVTSSREDEPEELSLQYLNIEAVVSSIVKKCFRVTAAQQIEATLHAAWQVALAGEPGPVVVLLSTSLLGQYSTGTAGQVTEAPRLNSETTRAQLLPVVDRLRTSKRPLLYVGGGCIGSTDQVRQFSERTQIPVLATFSGRGILPDAHPLSLYNDFGVSVSAVVNEFIDTSDLVLAVGCKFSHNGSGGRKLKLPAAKLLRVDSSALVLASNYPASFALEADARSVFDTLLGELSEYRSSWTASELGSWKERLNEVSGSAVISPPLIAGHSAEEFFTSLRAVLPAASVLVADSGLHQVLARAFFEVKGPTQFLCPIDFQSMGFGIPAAIGAALASKSQPVVALVGDGGFLCGAMELLTAVHEDVALKVIIFNDGYFGLIRQQQLLNFGDTLGVNLNNPEIFAFAQGLGVASYNLSFPFEAPLKGWFEHRGAAVLNVPLTDHPSLETRRRRSRPRQLVKRALKSLLPGFPLVLCVINLFTFMAWR